MRKKHVPHTYVMLRNRAGIGRDTYMKNVSNNCEIKVKSTVRCGKL